ncbi:cyclase [Corallococcus sp. AB049A]|uniref:Cyclase n=1 Tax=Corallococcus interemptor TaxID=2316720 RepID=A0A3A8QRL9_9BACT|nr:MULTISPECIES: adenylate/guanylate cyclase domain-containing protein [Corallococcus]RKH67522.1 cyclase [Corallococcus interemptor]RKI57696.1 cyclase [Corallococcus sp. AB049A]
MGEAFRRLTVVAPPADEGAPVRAPPPPARHPPPMGSVALVFTDIQGSTRLWERCGQAMRDALELHDGVLRALLSGTNGYEVKSQGDAFMVAFASPVEAALWCLRAQEALLSASWPEALLDEPDAAQEHAPEGLTHRGLRVRMGVHVGEPDYRLDPATHRLDYLGPPVNIAARVAGAGHGGQVLLSGAAWARVQPELASLGMPIARPLGAYRLRGVSDCVSLVELLPASLAHRRFGPLRAQRERPGNLPALRQDLVGRAEELETLRQWMSEGARLITILGPGGMGKTRLATHFGALESDAGAWEGGVWRCDLEEALTEEDLCHAVGRALGVPLTADGDGSMPAERLGRALAGCGDVLVILDNVEQVVRHVPATLGHWRVLAPRARFLVTTREALRLPGERVLDLAPLSLPEPDERCWEAILRSDAVRLFVQRAQETRGDFVLSDAEAPRVADIVRQLDGIALAIELAAARVNVLGVEQLRERLSKRFDLLRVGRRDAPARQATLRGAIDWSWNLLEPAERAALAQCSVFRGGFTLEAAEAVLVLPEGSPDVLEVVHSLRSQSLLCAREEGAPGGFLRLGLYESIREYAALRLKEMGDEVACEARHADTYVRVAGRLRERVQKTGGATALRRLALERENLLAACDNALAVRPVTAESLGRALETLGVLEPDARTRGPVGLLVGRLERALEASSHVAVAPLKRAEALAVLGRAYLDAGQAEFARQALEEARGIFHTLGEAASEKRVLVDLSIVARHAGDGAAAWTLMRDAQALPSGNDRWLEAYAVGNLGLVEQVRHGPQAAIPHLRASLALFHEVGDVTFEVGFLTNCAVAIGEAGDGGEAVMLLGEALGRALSVEDRAGQALARLNLGCYLMDAGGIADACEHLESAVRLSRLLGQRLLEGTALGELGRACLARGDWKQASTALTEAISILGRASRWQSLRFIAHRAALDAARGDLKAAREGFGLLDASPELREDPALLQLVDLLRAALDLAEADAAPSPGAEGDEARARARRRIEAARNAPRETSSSDIRGALRFLEAWPGLTDSHPEA